MYNFSYFKENDKQTLLKFMEDFPFVVVTGCFSDGRPVCTQIPVMIEERNGELFIQGHIMRNTDHHKAWMENPKALFVFTGPDCYVSASWYSDPGSGSTWNYMSVHVQGELRFMEPDELESFMRKLTLKYEKGDTGSPTVYDRLSEKYIQQMMPAITGIEMKIERIENVFKLSQNRDEQSYLNIIRELRGRDWKSIQIAAEMEKRYDSLFPSDPKE